MGLQRLFLCIGFALLVLPTVAWADDVPPADAPPAGVAEPMGAPPAPPPPAIVVEDAAPVPYLAPRPCPAPCGAPLSTFDGTVHSVTDRMPACAPACPMPRPMPRRMPRSVPRRRSCEKLCAPGYGGVMVHAYPGLGVGVEFGMWFCRHRLANVAWEVNLNYQDLTDDFNNINTGQAGKWVGARVGLKASFLPKCNIHPTVRAGLAWNIATGDVANDYDIGDIPETNFAVNYYGGYLGVGFEWDLFNGRVTTGPELWGFAGPLADRSQGDDGAYTATVAWHVILNF